MKNFIHKVADELLPDGLKRLPVLGFMLIAVLLPFGGMLLSWSLIACLVLWLIDGDWNEKFNSLRSNKWFWLFIGFYVFVLIGYTISDDREEASFKLLQKIVLVLLPLCFATNPIINRTKLLNIFTYAVAFNCLVLELRAIKNFFKINDTIPFFYDVYCYFIHPSYFALLVSIALVIALVNNITHHSQSRGMFWLLLSLFFSLNVLQSSSRAGMLGLLIVWIVVGFAFIRYNKSVSWKSKFILSLIPVFTIVFGFIFIKQTRLTTLKYAQDIENVSPANAESGQVRLLIWSEVLGLIKDQPLLGYGTGDVSNTLDKSYKELGMTDAYERHLNVHNQYLQTGLANGLIALLILLSILLLGTVQSVKQSDYIALGFFLLMGFHLVFESMLERREGLFTFAFFTGLFLSKSIIANQEKSSSPKLS